MNNDPLRMKDEGPDGLRELLRHGEAPPRMTPDQRAAGAAAVAKLGAVAAGSAGAGSAASGAAAAGTATAATTGGVGKLVLIVGGLATAGALLVVGGASLVGTHPDGAPSTAGPAAALRETAASSTERGTPRTVAAVMPVEMQAALPSPEPVEATEPQIEARVPRTRPLPEAATDSADALLAEAGLLESARRRLESDPRGALRDTRTHAARFPHAQLAAERELIAIDALRRLGHADAAERRARALLRRAPRGMYADRARSILEALDAR